MQRYLSQKVFITGGSSGIGLALAKAFASCGADIVIFARNLPALETARQQIVASQVNASQQAACYAADVTDFKQANNIFKQAVEETGAPDILINCVGIAQPSYFETISFEMFEKTIRTNLYSVWNACTAFVPHMKRKGGHIVNTASIAGFIGVFGYTDYCMSKFGIIGFSEALRSELKPYNINVSVLCPPDTDTPGYALENATKPVETAAVSGNAKLLSPEFVAHALLKQLPKKKLMIIPGRDGKMTWLLKRFIPGVVERFMDKAIRKVKTLQ
jgi:short-subunit dehydrogenase